MSVLISDPDTEWSRKVCEFLADKFAAPMSCQTGKDCQLKIYNGQFHTLILDIDTYDNSGFEVLRYMRLNHPEIKVVLTFASQARFEELKGNKIDLNKFGVSSILVKPYAFEDLVTSIEQKNQGPSWKTLNPTGQIQEEKEVDAADDEFTSIHIKTFYSGNTNIFDHYVRLGPNKYIKVLHKGDHFDENVIQKYSQSETDYLYFKKEDRGTYISFINEALRVMIDKNKGSSDQKLKHMKNAAEKYIEEIYTVGMRPQLIEESKSICQNMYNLVEKDRDLLHVFRTYEDYDRPAYSHLFLVSFLSVVISKHLDWTSPRTTEITALGGLLHDIGKLQLPPDIRDKKMRDMNEQEKELYRTHPILGAKMLEQFPSISEPVRQIVYQHHEWVSGDGFPNRLSGNKIYPLAKIVSLANEFANILGEKKITPLDALREFIPNKELTIKFDPIVIKSLVTGLLSGK